MYAVTKVTPARPTITGRLSGAATAWRWLARIAAKPAVAAVVMPSPLRRSAITLPSLPISQSRKLDVPQSTAT